MSVKQGSTVLLFRDSIKQDRTQVENRPPVCLLLPISNSTLIIYNNIVYIATTMVTIVSSPDPPSTLQEEEGLGRGSGKRLHRNRFSFPITKALGGSVNMSLIPYITFQR